MACWHVICGQVKLVSEDRTAFLKLIVTNTRYEKKLMEYIKSSQHGNALFDDHSPSINK